MGLNKADLSSRLTTFPLASVRTKLKLRSKSSRVTSISIMYIWPETALASVGFRTFNRTDSFESLFFRSGILQVSPSEPFPQTKLGNFPLSCTSTLTTADTLYCLSSPLFEVITAVNGTVASLILGSNSKTAEADPDLQTSTPLLSSVAQILTDLNPLMSKIEPSAFSSLAVKLALFPSFTFCVKGSTTSLTGLGSTLIPP